MPGIWYLVASDGGKLKTFVFSKVTNIEVLDSTFKKSPEIIQTILDQDSVWVTENKTKVVLKVDTTVSDYFKRRKLIPNQVIDDELKDGSLVLSTEIGHNNQILPIVRYWLPHISIITPSELQSEMESELRDYLNLRKIP